MIRLGLDGELFMKKSLFTLMLGLSLTAFAQADTRTYELTITHVPESIQIIKQCGNSTQVQSVQVENKDSGGTTSSFHYSSATSMTTISNKAKDAKDVSDGCTLTIRTLKACDNKDCQHSLDFNALINPVATPAAPAATPTQTP